MDDTIGTSQTSLVLATNATAVSTRYYFTRFVSAPLSGITSVTAQTWTANWAHQESNSLANFPVSVANTATPILIYVWRPSSQTKVGNILDGNSTANCREAPTTETSCPITFPGSLVSSVQDGDVICYEVVFFVTQGVATTYNDTFYYDGTVVNTGLAAVTDHASYIETPQTLTFGGGVTNYTKALPTETTSISESVARQLGANRALATQTTTGSETLARQAINSRALSAETITVGESQQRVLGASRTIAAETVTVGETSQRVITNSRTLATETVPITESVTRVVTTGAVNYVRTLPTETVTISEGLQRLYTANRPLPTETVTISETLNRVFSTTRTLATQTVTIGETIARAFTGSRPLAPETIAVSESIQSAKGFIRTIATQTVTIGESLVRVFNGSRLLPTETVTSSESLTRLYSAMRPLAVQTTAISETLARLATNIRALAIETVASSESLARMLSFSRQIAAQTVTISETIARLFTGQRLLATQTTTISDSVATLYTPAPPAGTFERQMPLENVAITESLNRVVTNSRALLNPIALSFDGVNDYLNCGNDASLWSGTLTKFSFSLWLYNDTSITTSALILDHNSNNAQSFVVYNSTVGSAITFRIVKNDLSQINCTASGLSNIINRWVHLVGTYDSTLGSQNMKFYVDSVRTGNQPNVNETLTSSGILTLSGAVTDHKGYMRDFKFWNNQALSQTEVNNVFSDNPAMPVPNYWLKMDEGAGNPVDAITGTKTATLTNGTTWLTNPDGITISSTLSAQKGNVRTLATQTTAITDSLVRAYGSARTLPPEVVSVTDSISRLYAASRTISEAVVISDTLDRSYSAIRQLSLETVSILDTVDTLIGVAGNAFVRTLLETVDIDELLERVFTGSRSFVQTTSITDQLQALSSAEIPLPPELVAPPTFMRGPRIETIGAINRRPLHPDPDSLDYRTYLKGNPPMVQRHQRTKTQKRKKVETKKGKAKGDLDNLDIES